MMQIVTSRLLLRPFTAEDLDIIYRIYSDEEILQNSPMAVMDLDAAQSHLKKIIRDWEATPLVSMELAVIRKDSGEKIGRCHILLDPESESGMIGWHLIQDAWGCGYATEITEALLDCCFRDLSLHRAYALCNSRNAASRRVLEKSGLRLEGWLRNKCKYDKNGIVEWHDELIYAVLASERPV